MEIDGFKFDPADPADGNPGRDEGDAALDCLLQQAVWPEPSPDSTERLRAKWFVLRGRRRWADAPPALLPNRRVLAYAGAVAASAAAVLLVVLSLWREPWRRTTNAAGRRPDPPVAVETRPVELSRVSFRGAAWRPPTPLEAALARQAMNQPPAAPPRLTERQRAEMAVGTAIDALVRDPSADGAGALADLNSAAEPDHLEEALAAAVEVSRGGRLRAAVRLLAGVATRRSLPVLWQLADDPETHWAALGALQRLADPEALRAYARREADLAERRRLAVALAKGSAAQGLPLAAILVGPVSPPASSAALDGATEALFARLSDRNADVRARAARELARRKDPAVLRRLARMAEANVDRREALTALAYSGQPEARAFLDRAARSPELAGAVRTAILGTRTP